MSRGDPTIPAPPGEEPTRVATPAVVSFDEEKLQLFATRMEEALMRSVDVAISNAVGNTEKRYLSALSGINLKLAELRTELRERGADSAQLGSTLAKITDRMQRIVLSLDDGQNGLTGLSVLLVEDEPAIRDQTARVLVQRKARVWPVGSYLEAARAVAGMSFHAAVVDLRLESGSSKLVGLELAEEIRQTHPGMGLVISTGRLNGPDTEARIQALGARILLKPWPVAELVVAIRDVARISE